MENAKLKAGNVIVTGAAGIVIDLCDGNVAEWLDMMEFQG